MQRKVFKALCLLFCLLLLFGCGEGSRPPSRPMTTADTTLATTLATTLQTTAATTSDVPAALPESIPFDLVVTDVFDGDWTYFHERNNGVRTFFAGTRADYLALYKEDVFRIYQNIYYTGSRAVRQSWVYLQTEAVFTDAFFEKYDVIVHFTQEGNPYYTVYIRNIVAEDGKTTLYLERLHGASVSIESVYFRAAIAIIPKGVYNGTPLSHSYYIEDVYPEVYNGFYLSGDEEGFSLASYYFKKNREASLDVLDKYR